MNPRVSVVSAVFDEDPRNLRELRDRLARVLEGLGAPWEAIFVEDGGAGDSRRVLEELCTPDARLRLIRLDEHRGQETALATGLRLARGSFLFTLDCDLQNRPEDIPRFYRRLSGGSSLVLGKRRVRGGWLLPRRLLSAAATFALNARWGARLGDWGCGFLAMRREVFEGLWADVAGRGVRGPLKLACAARSQRWEEIEIPQDPRRHGRSGYSWRLYCLQGWSMLTTGNTLAQDWLRRLRPEDPRGA